MAATLPRMESAVAVQRNGWGALLWFAMYARIAPLRSGTLQKDPRRIAWVVINAKKRSTWLSQLEWVGMKVQLPSAGARAQPADDGRPSCGWRSCR